MWRSRISMSKRRHIWKRWFWGFVVVWLMFFIFRVSTEIGQRRALLPTAYTLFFLPIDQYCAKHGMKWNLLVEDRYHYWSSLDLIVVVKDPKLKAAKIQAKFECRWFGLFLEKVEITRGDLYYTPWIDVTDDFLSKSLRHPMEYFDQNPLPKSDDEYLSGKANYDESVAYMIKKAKERSAERTQKEGHAEIIHTLITLFVMGIYILAAWLIWGTIRVWIWMFTKRFRLNKRIRLKLVMELLGLPLLVGILIVSMVLADPIGSMPVSFWMVYSLNGFLALVGTVLYIMHIVSIRKRFRQIARVIKMRLFELQQNEPRVIGLE
jgi:hypothetical protein